MVLFQRGKAHQHLEAPAEHQATIQQHSLPCTSSWSPVHLEAQHHSIRLCTDLLQRPTQLHKPPYAQPCTTAMSPSVLIHRSLHANPMQLPSLTHTPPQHAVRDSVQGQGPGIKLHAHDSGLHMPCWRLISKKSTLHLPSCSAPARNYTRSQQRKQHQNPHLHMHKNTGSGAKRQAARNSGNRSAAILPAAQQSHKPCAGPVTLTSEHTHPITPDQGPGTHTVN
jgi:hypothetical protein